MFFFLIVSKVVGLTLNVFSFISSAPVSCSFSRELRVPTRPALSASVTAGAGTSFSPRVSEETACGYICFLGRCHVPKKAAFVFSAVLAITLMVSSRRHSGGPPGARDTPRPSPCRWPAAASPPLHTKSLLRRGLGTSLWTPPNTVTLWFP